MRAARSVSKEISFAHSRVCTASTQARLLQATAHMWSSAAVSAADQSLDFPLFTLALQPEGVLRTLVMAPTSMVVETADWMNK